MEGIRFILLGGLEIQMDGRDVTPTIPKKAALLLAYLAMTGRSHSRPFLANLLWGESPDTSARLSLRTALWSLGEGLSAHLETGRHQVGLRPGAFQADAVEFARLAGGASDTAPAQRRASLQQAAGLYRGELLAGWAAGRAPAFEEWLMAERQRLQDIALEALYRLAGHYARDGAYPEAIATVRSVLALEPWHEEAHRQLMQLLALTGRRGEALMQYRACRRLLVLELGTEPAMETQALYRDLLQTERRAARAQRPRLESGGPGT